MPKETKSNKRNRVPKREWWPHDQVYTACKKAKVCALWHYKDGCTRGDSCPFKHELLTSTLIIDGKRYDAAAIAKGDQAEYPRSLVPPSHNNAKKQKSQGASMFLSARPATPQKGTGAKPAPAYESCSSTSHALKAANTDCSQRVTLKAEAHTSPLKSPAPVQPPASPRFASSKQQLSKVEKEIARLTAMKAVLEVEAKEEESSLNSAFTARCQRFEYLERPTAQMAGTQPYHARYTAVKAHSLGYNDNKPSKRTSEQQQCHRQLRAVLRDSMQRTHCYNCRRCCRSLQQSEQEPIACERCYAVLYCSITCLQNDAQAHAYQCYYHPGYCLRSEQAVTGRSVQAALQVCDANYSITDPQETVSDDSGAPGHPPPLALDGGHAPSNEEAGQGVTAGEDPSPATESLEDALHSIHPGPVRGDFPSFTQELENNGHDLAWDVPGLDLSASIREAAATTAAYHLAIATRSTLSRYMDMEPCANRSAVMARGLAYGFVTVAAEGQEPEANSFDVTPEEAAELRLQPAFADQQGP